MCSNSSSTPDCSMLYLSPFSTKASIIGFNKLNLTTWRIRCSSYKENTKWDLNRYQEACAWLTTQNSTVWHTAHCPILYIKVKCKPWEQYISSSWIGNMWWHIICSKRWSTPSHYNICSTSQMYDASSSNTNCLGNQTEVFELLDQKIPLCHSYIKSL